ncbi:hypothetical protein [Ulvibacter antarcticus]|uniref:Uncharacterized protein n=1 Tax=Ulvibacter antarcticus TaxID=442714 RepID=A0A3L9YX46_9FLAO|nr:hypothetical protein [Ulvibacter antarcticus]RMA64380.1 hypothetical protein BXY75_1255 [Ulvibacter antarcticus]
MEEYLVTITCEDISIFKTIIKENGRILEKCKGSPVKYYCFNAVLSKTAIEKIRHFAHVEIKETLISK